MEGNERKVKLTSGLISVTSINPAKRVLSFSTILQGYLAQGPSRIHEIDDGK